MRVLLAECRWLESAHPAKAGGSTAPAGHCGEGGSWANLNVWLVSAVRRECLLLLSRLMSWQGVSGWELVRCRG